MSVRTRVRDCNISGIHWYSLFPTCMLTILFFRHIRFLLQRYWSVGVRFVSKQKIIGPAISVVKHHEIIWSRYCQFHGSVCHGGHGFLKPLFDISPAIQTKYKLYYPHLLHQISAIQILVCSSIRQSMSHVTLTILLPRSPLISAAS